MWESWTIKKAECWKTDTFKLWCWRRLLTVPWTVSRSKTVNLKGNQPRIFIGRTDAEAEAPILWPPDQRAYPLEKMLMLGKTEDRSRSRQQRMRWLEGITDSMDMSFGKLREIVKNREAWRAAVHELTKSQTRLGNWTTLHTLECVHVCYR